MDYVPTCEVDDKLKSCNRYIGVQSWVLFFGLLLYWLFWMEADHGLKANAV